MNQAMAEFESIANYLERVAGNSPEKIAIYFEDHFANPARSSVTRYGTLLDQVALTANLLKFRYQLSPGDRIAWIGYNHPEMFTLIFAATSIGAVVVPLNWRLAEDELVYILADADPVMLFHDRSHINVACALAESGSAKNALACIQMDVDTEGSLVEQRLKFRIESAKSNADSIDNQIQPKLPDSKYSGHEPAMIVYTSGTTGRPKGAVLSHGAIICNARMSQHMYDLTKSDVVLGILPLFHIGGINIQPLPALLFGASVVLEQQFRPDLAVTTVEEKRITLINTVPTMLQAMMGSAEWKRTNLASLKSISIGSTDVPKSLIEAVHKREIPLVQVYGATETSPIAIYQLASQAFVSAGSIGQAGCLCEILLTDPEGNTVPPGQPGEIRVKGENTLTGYWNNAKATGLNMEDGWFKTGDVAYMDEQGYYWFCDRLKHVIISGGENIYPAEIERVISGVMGVDAVCVVGQDDKIWGQVPLAVVETRRPNQALESEVIMACRQQLAKFKVPREIVMTHQLPRNAMGKILSSSVISIYTTGNSDNSVNRS